MGDLPAVMAEVARNPVTILILVQPMAWNNLRELGRALERYYPKTPCWRFDPPQADAPQGRLGPWDWDQLQTGVVTILEDAIPAQPPAEVQNQSRRHQHRQVAEPLLTREELDMLLDHSWERQSHTRRPRRRHETEDGL
ncbi:MAG: hypothetical protein HC898_01265 [Phycisphaerales bacterium]|nr:hypothetical protein [Phycisphaerales bacterium]